jgi:Tol biopolymer transport system component
MIGQTIGNYQITEKIGAGGMGEVFRARDTKLDRDVAVKVLPDILAGQTERLARFEREAKLLAGLNHSHIAAIYGIEEFDGNPYLILEMVEGEDLSQRLSRGAVLVDEAVEIAQQIAEALEAAHEQGVIHRDLKPANIKLTPDGQVKVLDFGLAKALDTSGSDSARDLSQSPTVLGSSPTMAGVILGTAAYMSPEQARGKSVDKRADIFAFGIVLLEMLAGEQVFVGETVSDTLAAVLRAKPDFAKLPADTPPALRVLIKRCLEKDVRRRLRDIGEARITLENIRSGATGAEGVDGVQTGFLRAYGGWLAAAVVVIVSVVAMATWQPTGDAPTAPLRKAAMTLSRDDPSRRFGFSPSISPDGRYLVYVSEDQLWLRDLTAVEPRPIAGSEGAQKPFWSPDSEWIGYGLPQGIYKVPRGGGQPTLIGALPAGVSLGIAASACWTRDGRIVIGPGTTGLHQVAAQGGEVTPFLHTSEGETDFHEICSLPDGKGWVFVVHTDDGIGDLDVYTPEGSRSNLLKLEDSISDPAYSPTGHIVFRRSGTSPGIWAVPFSVDRLETTGDPFIVAAGGVRPSVAADGTLAYVAGVQNLLSQLVWVTRNGAIVETIGRPQAVSRPFPKLSPDEKAVLLCENFGDGREMFLYDVDSGNRRRVTFNDLREDMGFWHPNGRDILYYESGTYHTNLHSLDGSSEARTIADGIMACLTPDASQIVFARQKQNSWDWDLFVQPLDGGEGEPTLLLETPGVDWWPMLSPDGRFLLYVSNETGREEVYATTFPNPTTRWQVSVEGGEWPRWRADGKEIFYTTRDAMFVVDVSTTSGLTLSTPRELFQRPMINWSTRWADGFDMTADGQRFIMLQQVRDKNATPPAIVVVQNWFAEFDGGGGR